MDELEIDGKKYFSSRKAAREHKYHIDYIGQLIRAGKVNGKKVGRSWYVEETSLKSYLLQEAGTPGLSQPTKVEEVVVVVPPVVEEVIESQPEPIIEQEPVVIPQPVVTAVVEKVYESNERVVHMQMPERSVEKKSTIKYIEDNEPMLPVLEGRARSNADFVAIPLRKAAEVEEETMPAYETPVITVEKRGRATIAFPRIQTIAVLAVVVLAVAAAASTLFVTSIKVSEGQPASVIYTIK